jgi:hypothetical protein
MFENRSAELIPGSHFEEAADDELELVVPGGSSALHLRHGSNDDPLVLDSGQISEGGAMKTRIDKAGRWRGSCCVSSWVRRR